MSDVQSVGELVRKAETDYKQGNTQSSEYVKHSLSDTLERIDAYLNSKHLTGDKDSLGREKPFFNISVSAANIWFRATDIDRQHIKVRATKESDWFTSFLATVHLRDWMRRENFGQYLNSWGRTMSRYGSAVTKIVENSKGLHISVVPFNRIIFDAIDFKANPKIEIIELTEGELRRRVETHGYDEKQVDELCRSAKEARETIGDKRRKDNKNDYIKLYEVHGELPLSLISGEESDENKYTQQMHVISFIGTKKGRKAEYKDFVLVSGLEKHDPYRLDSLIEEDNRSLGIGAVEYLFDAQWMVNHSTKAIKDQLDLASKIIVQTSDAQFLGNNILTDLEQGAVMITNPGHRIDNVSLDSNETVGWQNYGQSWKQVGNEIVGISEAMLGAAPKSGTAWRQTEALLNESYSLFELMTENKGLALEDMLRTRIIPWIKKNRLDSSKEVAATLEEYEINRIDARHIKSTATRSVNKEIKRMMIEEGRLPSQEQQMLMQSASEQKLGEDMSENGNQRFFKPSDVDSKTWKEVFKDLEWDLEIDITNESQNVQEMLTTINTALQLVVTPGFESNPKAQALVGRILELTGAMSPVEYSALPKGGQPAQLPELTPQQ